MRVCVDACCLPEGGGRLTVTSTPTVSSTPTAAVTAPSRSSGHSHCSKSQLWPQSLLQVAAQATQLSADSVCYSFTLFNGLVDCGLWIVDCGLCVNRPVEVHCVGQCGGEPSF